MARTDLNLHRQRVADRGVPTRVLLIDTDESVLAALSGRLAGAGFETTCVRSAQAALELADRDWFPVILCAGQMPAQMSTMDGLSFTAALREREGDASYIILMFDQVSTDELERGYSVGVDDYLSTHAADAEVLSRISAGLNTALLRRELRKSQALLAESQAQRVPDDKEELAVRLRSEIARARRYRRSISVLLLGVHPIATEQRGAQKVKASKRVIDPQAGAQFVRTLQGVIRIEIDTVLLYEQSEQQLQFAIVLPETGPAEVSKIRSRVRAALEMRLREHPTMAGAFDVSVGAASTDASSTRPLSAEEFMAAAEDCRRCMASCGARRLAAVQTSVMNQVAIPCRYGYAVADHCLEIDQRYGEDEHAEPAEAAVAHSK